MIMYVSLDQAAKSLLVALVEFVEPAAESRRVRQNKTYYAS